MTDTHIPPKLQQLAALLAERGIAYAVVGKYRDGVEVWDDELQVFFCIGDDGKFEFIDREKTQLPHIHSRLVDALICAREVWPK